MNQALVLVADHELNPSSFASRVAAGTGADLYACLGAALATFSGPKHGGACDQAEALLDEAVRAGRVRDVLMARARRGESLPGFGHPLYPQGDPRTPPLIESAQQLAPRSVAVRVMSEVVEVMQETMGLRATVDYGVVMLSRALGLPPGAATALFAVGRTAGWVAHALEQRAAGFTLRPRARYVGV